MERHNIYIPKRQRLYLDERAKRLGICRAELIRRIFDADMDREKEKKETAKQK